MAYSRIIASAIVGILGLFGIELSSDDAVEVASAALVLGSFVSVIYHRVQMGGVHWHGLKK